MEKGNKSNNKVAPFSMKLKQYIGKLLNEGMEPDEIVKDLGLPDGAVHSVVKLKKMNAKRLEFKKVAENWKNASAVEPPTEEKEVKRSHEVKKKTAENPRKKDTAGNLEKKMVRKVENAMVIWITTQRGECLTLYNLLEKAESLANEIFTKTNYQPRGFKVTENWFRDFRKRHRLHKFRYAEEIERVEAKKLAKKFEKVVPDFVWGECAGCDGTDCPVHEWISSKPAPQKKTAETAKSKQVVTTGSSIASVVSSGSSMQPVSSSFITIGDGSQVNPSLQTGIVQSQPVMSFVQCFQPPLQSLLPQQVPAGVPAESVERKPNQVGFMADVKDSNSRSGSDSDSSNLVIAGEDDEEMDDSIVKPEEPTVMFFDGKGGSVVKEEGGSVDEQSLVFRKAKVKEAFELFAQGLALLEQHDRFVQRRQTFCDGLHKLLDLYQLPEHN